MAISIFIISIMIGFLLGIISGVVPGIHTNTFAFILAAFAPVLVDVGFSSIDIAVIIVSNALTHTFFNIIPSVFLGAPDADTSLAVLPGHRMLLDGYGSEAVRLSALGSAGSVLVSLILIIPMALFFSNIYQLLDRYIGWILLIIVIIMIYTEQGEVVEGQGSLVRMKFRVYAVILFLISGSLGLFALRSEGLIDPIINLGKPSILMPLFSGLFGASMLVISMQTETVVPKQIRTSLLLPPGRIFRGTVIGSTAGSLVAWLPGITASVATVLARLTVKEDYSDDDSVREFIVSISGVNTANAILGLIALFVIDRTRSGAMVAVFDILGNTSLDINILIALLIAITAVSIAAYFMTIWLGERILPLLSAINYRILCSMILIGLSALVMLFTGGFGLVIYAAAVPIGMLAPYLKIRRSHAMGVLLLPLLIFYL
jgi:putative membrane protein